MGQMTPMPRLDATAAERIQALAQRICDTVERVIVGKRAVIEQVLVALLADGHVLIEDVPGIGKTKLARTLCQTLGGTFQRIQFTPDLLPTDILGTLAYQPQDGSFRFHPGPIFAHVILADEVNRGTPRTQAALLEAMEERQVTVERQTYPLPRPFLVIATQNPVELEGTFPLPEAQLDRFLLRIRMGYPEREDERALLGRFLHGDPLQAIQPVTSPEELIEASQLVRAVHISPPVEDYLLDLVARTRTHPDLTLGVSPRGTLALARAAQAYAILHGRAYVLPDDVRTMAIPALAHRLLLAPSAELHGRTAETVLGQIVAELPVPVEPDVELLET
ncbi:MoxR family ATPase [Thermorudis peleae]|uniref:AAA family ATPase n=1 Tax=Thermorudis peleae TaxID=1382356 RepID=UPI000B03A474